MSRGTTDSTLTTGQGRGPAWPKQLALIFGLTYLVVGVVGFAVTGLDGFFANGDDAILIFEVNPFHNVVHIGVGALWLVAARMPHPEGTEGIHIGIGGVYLLTTVLGMIGALEILSIDGATAPDNFLHLVSGLAALGVGVASVRSARPATG